MGSRGKHAEVELEHWGRIGGEIMDACWSHERRFQRELQMFEKEEREKKRKMREQFTACPNTGNLLHLS